MKILIATDGSPFSEAAVKRAGDLVANLPDTEIRIVSVYEKLAPMAGEPFGVSREYYQQAEGAARKLSEEAVKQAEAMLRERFPDGKFTLTTEIERGRTARLIVEAAEEWKADLIVMGSHGYGFWERNLMGSVSDAVVHHAPCSVLIVRPPAA